MPTLSQPLPEKELTSRITMELRRLCIPGHVRGFTYLISILLAVIPDPSRLALVTKSLYPDVARTCGVTCSSVERALRTAISISWLNGGREVLEEMACHCLKKRPTTTEFLDIVADYIRHTS